MEEKSFKKYIILWLSQSVSGLGSSMTGFALVLWAYGQSHSAMSVSLMSFCNYVPYVLLSLFAGDFIDRHKKKTIMLVSDSIAAAGSLAVLAFLFAGYLEVWNIYAINAVVGIKGLCHSQDGIAVHPHAGADRPNGMHFTAYYD